MNGKEFDGALIRSRFGMRSPRIVKRIYFHVLCNPTPNINFFLIGLIGMLQVSQGCDLIENLICQVGMSLI
jgi:hypothetical protein